MAKLITSLCIAAAAVAGPGRAMAQETYPDLMGAPGEERREAERAASEAAAAKREAQKQAEAYKTEQKRLAKLATDQKAEQQRLQKLALDQAAEQTRLSKELVRVGAEQRRLADQAEKQTAEQKRLAALADKLEAQQRDLDQKRAELEKAKQEAAEARQLAAIETKRLEQEPKPEPQESREAEVQVAEAEPEAPRQPQRAAAREDDIRSYDRPEGRLEDRDDAYWRGLTRADFVTARRLCLAEAEQEAWSQRWDRVEYVGAQRFNESRGLLQGRMRLEDRRGFFFVDSTCEVRGDDVRFEFVQRPVS